MGTSGSGSSEGRGPSAWTLDVGGLAAQELHQELLRGGISLNALAEQWLASEGLALSLKAYRLNLVACTLRELGFPQGATMPQILTQAQTQGLYPVPLEAAAYLRLHYREQPEGSEDCPVYGGRAPHGSLTLASEDPGQGEGLPRGLYLRRIDGVLWLRGYRADDLHTWDAEDVFVFRRDP